MAYRKRQKGWKQPRYYLYWEKVVTEKKRDDARLELTYILAEITKQKCEAYWENAQTILKNMQDELLSLGPPPSVKQAVEVIHYCIKIFDIASRYQDKLNGGISFVPEEKTEDSKTFNNDLYFCGRHESFDLRTDSQHGSVPYWNTTKKGQEINLDTIMFGPDIGFPQKSADYWIKLSKKKKVATTQVIEYSYGKVAKPGKSLWITQALVEAGIHKFCKTAYRALTEDIELLLA